MSNSKPLQFAHVRHFRLLLEAAVVKELDSGDVICIEDETFDRVVMLMEGTDFLTMHLTLNLKIKGLIRSSNQDHEGKTLKTVH